MNMNDIQIPDNNYYLFKSCTAGSIYPGIELSTRYILDNLELNYTDDPKQSSCTGFGVHIGTIPMETNMALNARNLSIAAETDNNNVICVCPMSYNNLKHCQKLISKDNKLEKRFSQIINQIGHEYNIESDIKHVSDAFLIKKEDIVEKALKTLSGVRAVTHHGCHYSKFFFKEVGAGNYEHPTVLDEILKSLDCEVLDYTEQFLCCGGGLHRYMIDKEYSREIFRSKFSSIVDVKPDIIVTQCPGCTFSFDYLQESLNEELKLEDEIPVLYISELLALLMGAEPENIGIDMHAVDIEPFLRDIGILE